LLIEYIEHCIESARKAIEEGSGREGLMKIGIPDKFGCWQMPQMFRRNLEAIYDNSLAADR